MNPTATPRRSTGVSRRDFLKASAAAGAGLVLVPTLLGDEKGGPAPINVAIIGTGLQGRELIEAAVRIDGIRFKAVCDIWPYSQTYSSGRLKDHGHKVNVYTDYQELLDKEKDVQAVIVATPDFMHAEHTIACLKAGKHVYCEKEMSNDLAKARQMVLAARETGNLLQIGHQRRSNPRYLFAKQKLIDEAKLCGRITHIYGQWYRSTAAAAPKGLPKGSEVPEAMLRKYGYENAFQFRNWRWFKKYGGGPMVDLGSHQIDVFGWFLGAKPKYVLAEGGRDYWRDYEWCDNVLAMYAFETPAGLVRASYQTLSTTTGRGYFETFMGDQGTLQISEDAGKCRIFAEGALPRGPDDEHLWQPWVRKGCLIRLPDEDEKDKKPKTVAESIISVYRSLPPVAFVFNTPVEKHLHQPHLENFFDAVRGKGRLNCPAEVGYETAVQVLKVNEALEAGKKVTFDDADFKA